MAEKHRNPVSKHAPVKWRFWGEKYTVVAPKRHYMDYFPRNVAPQCPGQVHNDSVMMSNSGGGSVQASEGCHIRRLSELVFLSLSTLSPKTSLTTPRRTSPQTPPPRSNFAQIQHIKIWQDLDGIAIFLSTKKANKLLQSNDPPAGTKAFVTM